MVRVVTAVARRVGWYWGRERWVCVRVKGERVVRRAWWSLEVDGLDGLWWGSEIAMVMVVYVVPKEQFV